ncbi:MAG: redoxin domain-containing protein [Verrucomicrobiae bacterium]|nr:redoxin domain-containing protein [Verrucomicrobiae bacterium]
MTQPCLLSVLSKGVVSLGAAAFLLPGTPLAAQEAAEPATDDPAEGHSFHGEVFNDGPRQAAVLIPGTGDVHFEVTTESAEARRFFDQGIGQLHGFWDFEAERSFRQVAAIDPDCAMAYWGMAMANLNNAKRAKGFAEEAVKRKDRASERERLFIEAYGRYFEDEGGNAQERLRRLTRALEDIADLFPKDLETRAFLAKHLYYANGKGVKIESPYAANLLLGNILAEDPDHPANHYRIHLWDSVKPANALGAAAMCGPAAPGIAHMWHMPGHTYSKLHRYADAVWQQEASARVDHAHMMRFRVIPDQIHNFAHNNEWLIRNLNFLGKAGAAEALAKNMIELPRLAKFKKVGARREFNPAGGSWQYGRVRLRDTLINYEKWEELIRLAEGTDYLRPDPTAIPEREWNRFLAIARFETGDRDGAEKHAAAVSKALTDEVARRDAAVAKAEEKAKGENKKEDEIKKAKGDAGRPFAKTVSERENALREVEIYRALAADPPDQAGAVERLDKLKDIAPARHARLFLRAGELKKAEEKAGAAVKAGAGEVLPLAAQVEILHAAGKKDEARKAFDALRTVAADADADLAPLNRLGKIAGEFGYPEDWRLARPKPDDLGERPALDSLGPVHWSPSEAPAWELPDAEGKLTSLESHRGRPLVVIFYLGKGCTHCMEQLNNFAPSQEAFAKAGIALAAISTDTPDGLRETYRNATDENAAARNPFPFPLYSDADLAIFKKYRAYDDFEKMALHGTFLIDGEGRIRWQDISYDPFNYPEFLLEEAKRLLSFGDS